MEVMKTKKTSNYFEKVYLGKKNSTVESKRIQKLLSAKALVSSTDSRGLSTADLKRMLPKNITVSEVDFESIMNPFDMA